MNNQSPLIPQGSLLEQRNKGRTRVKIAVFLVLTIHGIGLMALLMQGCKKEPDASTLTPTTTEPTNTPAPAFVEPTNAPATLTNVAAPTNNATPAPVEVSPPMTPGTGAGATEYVIVKNDTFSTIAKKFHVSVKSILDANPSVEPTKLKIGQSIHIPAALVAASMAAATTSSASATDTGATGQTYAVKSGDSLSKIAGQFGVTVKGLRSANNLKTDKIVVGQKLKIPGKSAASSVAALPASAGTSAPAATPPGQ